MFKCVNGHSMGEGQKFCGECGGASAAPETGQCGACNASMLKANKFCGECGTPAGPLGVDLEASITELDTFIKARAAVQGELLELPTVDETVSVDQREIDRILKSAAVVDPSGEELGMEAGPIIAEFLKGLGISRAEGTAYAEHQGRVNAELMHGQQMMLKSTLAIAQHVAAMGTSVAAVANSPRAPRVIHPGVKLGVAADQPDPNDIGPDDLMVKATAASMNDGTLLSAHEISVLEQYTLNDRWPLSRIEQANPELAARVRRAIAPTTH